jgi:phospholipase C
VHRPARRGVAAAAALAAGTIMFAPAAAYADSPTGPAGIKNIVVIYQENHSFDNLFGDWEGVNGIKKAADSGHVTQVDANGVALPCLPQNDVNLAPLPATCHGSTSNGVVVDSHFTNQPFLIDDFIKPTDKTCPPPGVFAGHGVLKDSKDALPGGCTADLVHRYYQEQYQIHSGKMDRYVVGSDAIGLTMGRYSTTTLPIYAYLHQSGAPNYVIADSFFQAAFGGSYLNHQWLIAAATPKFAGATKDGSANDLHSVVGANGLPVGGPAYPLLPPADPALKDKALTQVGDADGHCVVPAGAPTPPAGTVCGDYSVNTIQPFFQPYSPPAAGQPLPARLPPLSTATIGDRLSAKGVDWAWYSGGWSNADGRVDAPGWTNGTGSSAPAKCADPNVNPNAVFPNCPDKLFQFHHQAFNYYANFAPGTQARAKHLLDESQFISAAKTGHLKPVTFVKPLGDDNEHPGYASETTGSSHLVDLVKAVVNGPQAEDTMVVVTYDEFGGQWDHVSPPKVDKWGPGTRIPALLIAPKFQHRYAIDHTTYDTTSVLSTIEKRFHLPPLTTRDRNAADLGHAFDAPPFAGLPITGTPVGSIVGIGLGLALVGAVGVLIGRRRA